MHAESAITEIAYDADRAKLFVRFDGGDRYVYVGVPGEVHRSFLESPSRAGYFDAAIRDNYPFNRIDA